MAGPVEGDHHPSFQTSGAQPGGGLDAVPSVRGLGTQPPAAACAHEAVYLRPQGSAGRCPAGSGQLRSPGQGGSSPPSPTLAPSSPLSSRVAFLASHVLSVLGRPHARTSRGQACPRCRRPPCPIPASPKGGLQPQGAHPQSSVRAGPTAPSALSQAASCLCGQPLPELTSPSPQTHQLSALSTCPTCEHSALLPRKVRLRVLGLVQVLRHMLPSVPNQKLLFLGSDSLPGLWAAAQCQGAQSWGSPGLWRDRLLLPAAGQMEPQWWGLLPARCAQGISVFKAAFVPGACSRKNCLAAPRQETVRPLGSTGSVPQPVVGPRSGTPAGCHLPPSSWMARGQDCPPGGMGKMVASGDRKGGRAWGLVQPCFDPQSPGQRSGYPGQPLPTSAGRWPRVWPAIPHGATHCPLCDAGHTQHPRLLSAPGHRPVPAQRHENLANSCQAPPSTPRVSQTSSYSLHTSKAGELTHCPWSSLGQQSS